MISIIVAIDENNGIGRANSLLWHLSDDLKRFKAITTGHTVIMGRNTWLSLPFRPLKNRRNIVISTSMPDSGECTVVRSVPEALALCSPQDTAYIIGGGEVYREMTPFADELIVTHVMRAFPADTFFPPISPDEWEKHDESGILHDEKSGLDYRYVTYRRKAPSTPLP